MSALYSFYTPIHINIAECMRPPPLSFSSVQLLQTVYTERLDSVWEWNPLSVLYRFYFKLYVPFLYSMQLLHTTHIESRDYVSEWSPLSVLYSFYIQLIQRRDHMSERNLFLFHAASVYKSYRESKLYVSSFSLSFIQLLRTTHTEKAYPV